jgi:hypothetical protein
MSRIRYVIAVICLLSVSGHAALAQSQATSSIYSKLLSALVAGTSVAVTVHFDRCTVAGTQTRGPVLIGGLRIDRFLVPGNQYIAFSQTHETLSPQNERVTEIVRYRVTPDDKMTIRTASIRARDGALSNQTEYLCALGEGVELFWSAHRGKQD